MAPMRLTSAHFIDIMKKNEEGDTYEKGIIYPCVSDACVLVLLLP